MQNIPPPYERFEALKEKIGLRLEDVTALDPYRQMFVSRKEEFAKSFYETLESFPDTRRFLELERRRGQLRSNWARFFELLFTSHFNRTFLEFLWKSGLTHVEMGVDQRHVNLGYILARHFCAGIIDREVPEADRLAVFETVAKKLDLCLLIATDAFLAATTQCDSEVMNGIAHQVRNPIQIIGGFVGALQRKEDPDSRLGEIYAAMYNETRRLERMVSDVGEFIRIFGQSPHASEVLVEDVVRQAWDSLKEPGGARLEMRPDPEHSHVLCDRDQALVMFRHILENAVEALDPADPVVAVSWARQEGPGHFLGVEIVNTGAPPSPEDMEKVFTPFYSSKPLGTGFGLPIARLVARRAQGSVTLRPAPGRGTMVLVRLPVA